jgi:RimJ/RimL family protein N-acetyltransferase
LPKAVYLSLNRCRVSKIYATSRPGTVRSASMSSTFLFSDRKRSLRDLAPVELNQVLSVLGGMTSISRALREVFNFRSFKAVLYSFRHHSISSLISDSVLQSPRGPSKSDEMPKDCREARLAHPEFPPKKTQNLGQEDNPSQREKAHASHENAREHHSPGMEGLGHLGLNRIVSATIPAMTPNQAMLMTDPGNALDSFQKVFSDGRIKLQKGSLDSDLYLFYDAPKGTPRFTYVRLEGKTVTAFVEFVAWDPIDGLRCMHIGYAVPEAYRGKGRATEIVTAAIAELKNGLKRGGIKEFYVEAMVGSDNVASQHVAAKAISDKPVETMDSISGLPALQYLRKIGE